MTILTLQGNVYAMAVSRLLNQIRTQSAIRLLPRMASKTRGKRRRKIKINQDVISTRSRHDNTIATLQQYTRQVVSGVIVDRE